MNHNINYNLFNDSLIMYYLLNVKYMVFLINMDEIFSNLQMVQHILYILQLNFILKFYFSIIFLL